MIETYDLKKEIKFNPLNISREMLTDKPDMRVALMCLKDGQQLKPHKAPMQLMMYCVEGKGTFTVGEETVVANEKTVVMCDPMVMHGFAADQGSDMVVMAIVTPADQEDK